MWTRGPTLRIPSCSPSVRTGGSDRGRAGRRAHAVVGGQGGRPRCEVWAKHRRRQRRLPCPVDARRRRRAPPAERLADAGAARGLRGAQARSGEAGRARAVAVGAALRQPKVQREELVGDTLGRVVAPRARRLRRARAARRQGRALGRRGGAAQQRHRQIRADRRGPGNALAVACETTRVGGLGRVINRGAGGIRKRVGGTGLGRTARGLRTAWTRSSVRPQQLSASSLQPSPTPEPLPSSPRPRALAPRAHPSPLLFHFRPSPITYRHTTRIVS